MSDELLTESEKQQIAENATEAWDRERKSSFAAPPGPAAIQYSDAAMVERAVRNAKPHRTTEAPRWVAVQDVFGYGSTTSTDLCRRFGLDPDEKVSGVKCHCEKTEAP